MFIWQVNWNPNDPNHKLFSISKLPNHDGKIIKSPTIIDFNYAKSQRANLAYYFYLELVMEQDMRTVRFVQRGPRYIFGWNTFIIDTSDFPSRGKPGFFNTFCLRLYYES